MKKNFLLINNARFIQIVSKDTGFRQSDIKEVMDSIERNLFYQMDTATEEEGTKVRFLPNVMAYNEYVPQRKIRYINGEEGYAFGRFRQKLKFFGFLKTMTKPETDDDLEDEETVDDTGFDEWDEEFH